jgi:drug/metabolite transporter (DMT)-like permease
MRSHERISFCTKSRGAGCLGALNMTLVTRALGLADASIIAPMDFLRLPAVAVAVYPMFHEAPTSATWLGARVICAAMLIASGGSIAWTARRRA